MNGDTCMGESRAMMTTACIARRDDDGDGWIGYYVHGDGAPDRLGRALVEMVQTEGAETVLARASVARWGWASFPDEPSVVPPEDAERYEWQNLIDADDCIKVYRASGTEALRSWSQAGIVDPQRPDARAAMAALRHRRLESVLSRAVGPMAAPSDAASVIRDRAACRTPAEADALLYRAREELMNRLERLRPIPGKQAEADDCAREVAQLDRASGRWN